MLNKKGFTIAEVIVSFSLITVILVSVISSTIYYRGKVKDEEVITQLMDFIETITKMVYDDILAKSNNKLIGVDQCVGTSNCVNFIDKVGNSHVLKIENFIETDVENNIKRGVYLNYDGTKYMLPDSDLGFVDKRICNFIGGISIDYYEENELYSYTVKLSYKHTEIDKQYDIMFTIVGKEGMWQLDNPITVIISFDAGDGTVDPPNKEIHSSSSETVYYGNLPTPTPASGYTFIGWYTEPEDGTLVESNTRYINGKSPIQLYAHYVQS